MARPASLTSKARKLLAAFAMAHAFCVAASLARAWDEPGHEVIATLANPQLNPKARQALADLAGSLPNPGQPYDSVSIACWMDDLRRNDLALPQHGLFLTWHYIDIGTESGDPQPSFIPGNDNEYQGNAVQALKRACVVLQGGTDPYVKTKAMACALVMHLVGDIHQPLHASTHYFYTSGGWLHHDAGGNKEYVLNGPPADPRFNLHQFWDSAWRASLDPTTGRVVLDDRYQEEHGHDPGSVRAFAQALAQSTPLPAGVDLRPNFDAWARESNQLARDFVYRDITATDSKKYCRLGSTYVEQAHALALRQFVLAAARLAQLLNQTLGADHLPPPPNAYPAGPPGQPYAQGY